MHDLPNAHAIRVSCDRCVPVLLSDSFVLPFEGEANAASARAGGGGLLPPHAVDSFVLRVPEEAVASLPAILDAAAKKHDEMLRNLIAYRTAYLYELPLNGQPHAAGAVCAVLADVARRFQPHLHAWRKNMTADGEVELGRGGAGGWRGGEAVEEDGDDAAEVAHA